MSKNIGENIKTIRKSLGFTQTDVANSLYTTPQNISRVESGEGEPTVEMLIGLSDLFGVSVDMLVGKTELPEKELLNNLQMYFKSASKEDLSERVFCVCKNILLGRYKQYYDKEKEYCETYSTLKQRNMLSVFSDLKDRPRLFAAVETSELDLDNDKIKKLSKVFLSFSNPTILQLFNKISALSNENDLNYDKKSFCSKLDIEEKDFEKVLFVLKELEAVDEKTVYFNDTSVTIYKPYIDEKIVLLLYLADLLYNESPDGNVN